jgi:hypothetical protein
MVSPVATECAFPLMLILTLSFVGAPISPTVRRPAATIIDCRIQVCNLGLQLLVIGPQLLDQLPRAGNIEIADVQADDISEDSDQDSQQE